MTRLFQNPSVPIRVIFLSFFLMAFIIASGKTNPLLPSPAVVDSCLSPRAQAKPTRDRHSLVPSSPRLSSHLVIAIANSKGIQAASEGHFRFAGVPFPAPLVEEYGPRAYPISVGGSPEQHPVSTCGARPSDCCPCPVAPRGASLRVPATSALHASPRAATNVVLGLFWIAGFFLPILAFFL
jgi:hypothetical protein